MKKEKNDNVAVLIRVPRPLLKRLDVVAKAQDRSRSSFVVTHLRQALEKKGAV